MNKDFPLRRIVALFFMVVLYFAIFNWIERQRHVKGPWEVTFTQDAGAPCLVINQRTLGILDRKMRFPGGSVTNLNLPQTVIFDFPGKKPPFGEIPFADLTFLPGTVTIDLFGHTVELIPRVLGIDGAEHPWSDTAAIELPDRPPVPRKQPPTRPDGRPSSY